MVYIIAEAGINHGGSLDRALQMVDAAEECGADAVKFQLYRPELLEPPGPRRDMLERCYLSGSDMRILQARCRETGIDFLCTGFDAASITVIRELVGTLKVASGYLRDDEILEHIADLDFQLVILSTGMASMGDIDHALRILSPGKVLLMHCTSGYPTPNEDVLLRAISLLRERFRKPVGFSDHTPDVITPALAVAADAEFVEKHFRLDVDGDGECPDAGVSLRPVEFDLMVSMARRAAVMRGHGVKRVMPSEADTIKVIEERRAWRAQQ